jgi:FtsH-binding integral membrane protein
MNRYQNDVTHTQGLEFDGRFRTYMATVYGNMSLGLLLTALTSYMVSLSPQMMGYIFKTPLFYVVLFAPLGMALYYSLKWQQIKTETAQGLFFLYAFMMGLSMSSIFIMYTGESIARIFLITSSMFGATSLYGYATKRDLTGMGSFMMMGLFGLMIAMVINLFMKSSGMQMMLSFLAVIIFTALTAYDVQRLKNVYYQVSDQEMLGKVAMMGAFILYLDFINLFIHLMHLLGNRRS